MHVLSKARARAEEHACTPARTQACKPEMHTCTDGGRRKRTCMHAERLHKHKHTWSRWLFLNLRLPCSPRPTASLGCTYATRHAAQCWAQNRRRYRSRTPRARDASRENCPGQANIRDCVILFFGRSPQPPPAGPRPRLSAQAPSGLSGAASGEWGYIVVAHACWAESALPRCDWSDRRRRRRKVYRRLCFATFSHLLIVNLLLFLLRLL